MREQSLGRAAKSSVLFSLPRQDCFTLVIKLLCRTHSQYRAHSRAYNNIESHLSSD
jgi:hypothetical protein